jgi:hypothetical protein
MISTIWRCLAAAFLSSKETAALRLEVASLQEIPGIADRADWVVADAGESSVILPWLRFDSNEDPNSSTKLKLKQHFDAKSQD